MKLQVAIDRVPLKRALELVDAVKDVADIIEIGTSLVKDYGMESVRQIRRMAPQTEILADIKTMDEGAYEFEAAYAAGADIATVMGAAAFGTVTACYAVAANRNKEIMIDLLETGSGKISSFEDMEKAIYCVHLPKDGPRGDVVKRVLHFCKTYPNLKRVAVAGGVTLEQIPLLSRLPIEVCIVGSAVTSGEDPRVAAQEFANAITGSVEG